MNGISRLFMAFIGGLGPGVRAAVRRLIGGLQARFIKARNLYRAFELVMLETYADGRRTGEMGNVCGCFERLRQKNPDVGFLKILPPLPPLVGGP